MVAISYLVTSYNKAAYLPSVLDSIRREREATGGEIILVDDGSGDGSDRICAGFAAQNSGVRYLAQANRGIYATYNRIIGMARGRWLRFCDGDDPLIAGSTARLVAAAERHGTPVAYGRAICYGPAPLVDEGLAARPATPGRDWLQASALMRMVRGMDFTTSRAVFDAAAVRSVFPLPGHLLGCQDFAIALPLAARHPFACVEEPVCCYLHGAENQLSAGKALMWHQTIRILQHHGALLNGRFRRRAIIRAFRCARRQERRRKGALAYQASRATLYGVSAAARLGLYAWDRAFDRFAAVYEAELAPLLAGNARPY